MNQTTLNQLNEMHLHGMQEALRTIETDPRHDDLTTEQVVSRIIQAEWDYRENAKIQRCLKGAGFRYQASINGLDYSPARGLDRNLIDRLSDCSYIPRAENIIITGLTGVGKSYLASALGHQACLHGKKVLYKNAHKLFAQLRVAKHDGTYLKELDHIARKDLFILDDHALEVLDHETSLMLLEILEDRTEQKSTIIASQLPFDKWYDVIKEKTIADAIMDRLVCSHKITLKGESMRRRKK